MPENEYKYLDHAGLTRFKGKIQDILDTKVDKENGKYIVTVDSALSTTSTNPVQNKVIASKLGDTDISSIGDGTVTGAISRLDTLSYQYKGVLSSSDDLNNVTTRGIYAITTQPTNAPNTYGTLIVTVSGSTVYQVMIRSDYIYTRAYTGNPLVWTNWILHPARAEVDNIKTNAYQYKGVLTSSDDLNNITTRGFYQIATKPTNSPIAWSSLMVSVSGETVYQTIIGADYIYTRAYTGNPIAWTEWLKQPTRAEIDQLNTELVGVGPNWHNSIYRGKNLGTSISTAQNTAIKNRTYDDMFIGDYWVINSHTWRIAAFDYYYRAGDTDFQKGNILVVPDANLYNFQMAYTESGSYEAGSANTTEGGYTNSYGFTTGLNQARTIATADFGSHVASHRILCTNATSSGKPSGWAWRDSDGVELMNEQQVYGSNVWGAREQNGYDVGSQYMQLPLFTLDPSRITVRQTYWLQDVRSATHFALVAGAGNASNLGASYAYGCRPAITLTYT